MQGYSVMWFELSMNSGWPIKLKSPGIGGCKEQWVFTSDSGES